MQVSGFSPRGNFQTTPSGTVSGGVGTSVSVLALPGAPYASETIARFIVAGSNTSGVISWQYGPPAGNPSTQAALATAASGGGIANGTYFTKVTAIVGGQEGPASNEQTITTTGTGISTITATWSAVPGATSYRVYFGTSSNGENVFANVGNVLTNIFTALPVTAGTPPTGLTATNGCIQLCNTVEIFGIPAGVTQISDVASATGSTLYVVIGDGL